MKDGGAQEDEEAGVKEGFRRKLARTGLKWAGHVGQMEGEQ